MFLNKRRFVRKVLVFTLRVVMICLFAIFAIIPIIFRYSYALQRSMLFLPFVPWPRETRFSTPEKLGLPGTRNFYITTDQGVQLGVWHVLPDGQINASRVLDEEEEEEWYEKALGDGSPVVLYMHGNSGSRAGPHRVELYRVLRNLGYHVVGFDYRGYADSSPVHPSEVGVVSDGKFMFDWVRARVKYSPLIVWGHSLGTGVSSHVLDIANSEGLKPHGLVLESPFSSLSDEIREHPLAQLFRLVPWFDKFFVEPFIENNLKFESDKHVANIQVPIMILHAEDDRVVPYKLGKKLYLSALESHDQAQDFISFITFPDGQGYGHKYICRAPELPKVVMDFIAKCKKA